MRLTEQEIILIQEYFRQQPVLRVFLFGSHARGEANAESDVDLLVELDPTQPVGIRFFGWSGELSESLGKQVDLGSADTILPFYRPFTEADKILIYDQAVCRQAAA
ncbi:nucleotidyltransferase family protein [Hymenobacter weizhouensis]|uniref:nucleotidyltransferase family protein n=1 Tax=Hymenobacter sp. YIM 151500-1 TaxID=2987689 RepID=UPI0022265F2C|nr:nucleotidyltransferase domain-containing protein [Hymenobacter sp. YIM 151500-1]UYZ61624.1 nucleotidyltransferase domain-containing protein [Hymenobacter sp. YIM 151500-1]